MPRRLHQSARTKRLLAYATKMTGSYRPVKGNQHKTALNRQQMQVNNKTYEALWGAGILGAIEDDPNYWPSARPKGLLTSVKNKARRLIRQGWRPLVDPVIFGGPVK